MNTNSTNRPLAGAHIIPLNADEARTWFDWFTSNGSPPEETHGTRFALAHSDSGVTWGYFDEQGGWKLGACVDTDLSPLPAAETLHELRLIGATAEVFIWRGDGKLQGRILIDDSSAFEAQNPLRPRDEGRKLRGECRELRNGFKRYVDAGGAQHWAPEFFPENFSVRHYLEQDPQTGAVRIAATRVVPEELS